MRRANPYIKANSPTIAPTPNNGNIKQNNDRVKKDIKEQRKLKKNQREKQRRTEINEKVELLKIMCDSHVSCLFTLFGLHDTIYMFKH
jgi:hypothetical protein